MAGKYGKIAVVKHVEDEVNGIGMYVIKDDFENNRKADAEAYIKERGVGPGEKLQIVRLDDAYENREVVTRETVVVKVEDATELAAAAGAMHPEEDEDGLESEEEDADIAGTEGHESYAEKLANNEYDEASE